MSTVRFEKGQFYFGSNTLSANQTYALYMMGASRFGASSSSSSNTCGICFDAVIAEKCSWACSNGKKHKYCKECTEKVLKQNFANTCPECRAMPLDEAHHRHDTGMAWLVDDVENWGEEDTEIVPNRAGEGRSNIMKMVLYLATVGAMAIAQKGTEQNLMLAPFENQMSAYTRDWPRANALVEWEPEKGKGRARSLYTRHEEVRRKARNR